MAILLKLDITTGDKIAPKEIIYEFKLLYNIYHLIMLITLWDRTFRINLGIVLDSMFSYTYLVSERPFLNII